MFWLCKKPQIQQIIYDEILSVTGNNNKINIIKNILLLNNLRAFIYEVLRMHSVVPIGVFRQIKSNDGNDIILNLNMNMGMIK